MTQKKERMLHYRLELLTNFRNQDVNYRSHVWNAYLGIQWQRFFGRSKPKDQASCETISTYEFLLLVIRDDLKPWFFRISLKMREAQR